MTNVLSRAYAIVPPLNWIGEFLPQLGLRLLLAYEFWESGMVKLQATGGLGPAPSWFAGLDYPFPFNVIPATFSWILVMWVELVGAVLLVAGLGTRLAVAALIILDIVAWASVHAGNGYNVCDNGFKLPLMYLIMFLPLLFSGPGKASLDHWIVRRFNHGA